MCTFGTKLRDTDGRPSGFDYVRIGLALSVVVTHYFPINLGDEATNEIFSGEKRAFVAVIMPMFFSLSGFLIAGSLYRSSSLFVFLGLRVIRIVPALAVEVTLSALVLGPIFTSYHLIDYFSSSEFLIYFLNIAGEIHYFLPGVFLDNPHPGMVNEQLWTIPWELKCYLAITVIALFRIHKHKYLFAALVIILNVLLCYRGLTRTYDDRLIVHGTLLIQSFLTGVVFFVFQDRIKFSIMLCIGSMFLMMGFLAFTRLEALSVTPAAYFTVFLGLTNIRRIPYIFSGDYSYGIYLYSFPIQQSVATYPWARTWWVSLLVVSVLTGMVAFVSWWKIEKPCLALRRSLQSYDERLTVLIRSLSGIGLPWRTARSSASSTRSNVRPR